MEQQPNSGRSIFAALVARLLLEEVAAGRWVKLSDGRLRPVDKGRSRVVQLFADTPIYVIEEETNAAPQDAAAGSGS